MKAFHKIFVAVFALIAVLFCIVNWMLLTEDEDTGRPYRVEISRLVRKIEENGVSSVDISECEYVTNMEKCGEEFYAADSDYVVWNIQGEWYRFDYEVTIGTEKTKQRIMVNTALGVMTLVLFGVLFYVRRKILKPFEHLSELPYELSKGNLVKPLKETKNRFFGRFLWGVDMLRENLEQQKERELSLQRDKKLLLLSLSHDIKTPLSAIKLYAKALEKGIYDSREKQLEIAEHIGAKADEIEGYVSQIITASREGFLEFDVTMGEFYLSELVEKLRLYYVEKLALVKTEFCIADYENCLISGDVDRGMEVLQNVVENAIKYGDGKRIAIGIAEEDGCILITVENSGCTLSEHDLPHMFESFWRGTNARQEKGSGLGLYIGRQLMRKMDGEIFAQIKDGNMCVTAVFGKL